MGDECAGRPTNGRGELIPPKVRPRGAGPPARERRGAGAERHRITQFLAIASAALNSRAGRCGIHVEAFVHCRRRPATVACAAMQSFA
jgi:hypothetical protein